MFREKALEKLRSPEQLDEPVLTIRRLDKVANSALTYLLSFFFLSFLSVCLPTATNGRAHIHCVLYRWTVTHTIYMVQRCIRVRMHSSLCMYLLFERC